MTGITGLVLLVVGLIVYAPAPSVGVVLTIIGFVLLTGLAFLANARARQSRGWTRVVNPGAARREYMAELAAREQRELEQRELEQRERETGRPAEDEPGG